MTRPLLFRRRTAPPPEPDSLLAESADRQHEGERAFAREMALRNPHSLPMAADGFRLVHYRELPDPHGPDLVVFGTVPRVREP